MKNKKLKGYWIKKKEKFSTGTDAKQRAGALRINEHVSHVTVDSDGEEYVVSYSVAKWYLEDLNRANISL